MLQTKNLNQLVNCAICTTLTCILATITFKIGPVPITLANFATYFSVGILTPKFAFLSQILYIILVTMGFPFSSNFQGGLGYILGKTGGFIVGYAFIALIGSLIYNQFKFLNKNKANGFFKYFIFVLACEIGTLACYLCGLCWFMYLVKVNFIQAFTVCCLPFLIIDLLKIIIAYFIISKVQKFLKLF